MLTARADLISVCPAP